MYGTLRDGKPATHRIEHYGLYDYGKFPYIHHKPGSDVFGCVREVSDAELESLDNYEGVRRGLFCRQTVRVWALDDLNGENKHEVMWVYVGDNIVPPLILSGDWLNQ